MDELQEISAEIIEIFNNKIGKLSTEDAETIYLCNSSMNLYMELGERKKALWEAKYTLQLLNNIINNGK
jgi:hypothetical protein